MRRLIVLFGLALTLGLVTAEADAGWHTMKAKWHMFWDRVELDWKRNNAWPEPFNMVDQRATRAPFTIMVDKGWQLQNTISNPLFDSETQQLTEAGRLKVQWILTQMPLQRRNVFVLRGDSEEITQLRLQSVQEAAVSFVGDQGASMVSLTDIVPRGGSGAYFERVQKGYETTSPPPQLPEMESSGDSN